MLANGLTKVLSPKIFRKSWQNIRMSCVSQICLSTSIGTGYKNK